MSIIFVPFFIGILKAARLGDLKMLTELHKEGYSLMSIDETGKTGLHYGARFGHKEIIKFLIVKVLFFSFYSFVDFL